MTLTMKTKREIVRVAARPGRILFLKCRIAMRFKFNPEVKMTEGKAWSSRQTRKAEKKERVIHSLTVLRTSNTLLWARPDQQYW